MFEDQREVRNKRIVIPMRQNELDATIKMAIESGYRSTSKFVRSLIAREFKKQN